MADLRDDVVLIDDIELDASLTERHTTTTDLTRHPVEIGVPPADYAKTQPKKVVVEGLFSNTLTNARAQNARGGKSEPGKAGAALVLFNRLHDLQESRRAVMIQTSLRFYDDMVMTSLEVPRDPRSGDAVKFSATFEQVVFVKVGVVNGLVEPKDPTRAVKKVEQGKKQPTPVTDPATKARARSVLLEVVAPVGIPGLRNEDPEAAP